MGGRVKVRLDVSGVEVRRDYWAGSWRALCRLVAEDLDKAPVLRLRPQDVWVEGQVGTLCVDTGSAYGSVAVHVNVYPQGALTLGALLDQIEVRRVAWMPLAGPYPFARESCPSVNGRAPVPGTPGVGEEEEVPDGASG